MKTINEENIVIVQDPTGLYYLEDLQNQVTSQPFFNKQSLIDAYHENRIDWED